MQATHPTTKARCLATAAMLSLLLNAASAQPASPPAPASDSAAAPAPAAAPASSDAKSKDDAVYVLSPFSVDSSKDEGYRATNTLAGTRINTDLKDLAAPISVVTKEFMNDIGATDVNDILAYQVGAESTRDFTQTGINLGRSSDGPAQDPTASQRGRGLAPYDITRDYFFSFAESSFSSLSTGTSVGFDPYNLDSVTVVRGPNSVLAGLGSPAGIINFSPQTANTSKDHTELTYRYGSYNDQRATLNSNVVVKQDILAFRVAGEWADAGFKQQPAYKNDRRYYLAGTWQPFKKTSIHASYEAVKVHQDLPNSLTPEDDITQWLALGKPSSPSPGVGATNLFTGQGGGEPSVIYNPNGTVAGAYSTAPQYGFVQVNLANVGIWQATRFGNDQYGDWQDLNTSASNALNKLNTLSVSIDQEILPGLDLNASLIHENLDSSQINLFRPDYVSYEVDVNQELPWGAVNPNYGKTFMYFRGLDNSQNTTGGNTVGRVTGTYALDLTKYNKWFGHYNFTGFLEQRKTESDFNDYNSQSTDKGTSYYLSETGKQFYLGGSAANGYVANTVPTTPKLISGQAYTNADGTTGQLNDAYLLKEESKQITKLGTSAVVLQAFLANDMIVPMFAVRRDTEEAGFSSNNATDPVTGLVDPAAAFGPLTKISAQTKTYGVVVHPLKWLNVFYNHSENFIPNAGSVDLLGNATPHPTGVSKDYGFSFDLLQGKLNFKVDWFNTLAASSADASVNFPLVQWTLPFELLGSYADLAQKAGVTNYQTGMAAGLVTGDPRLANAYTADTKSNGLEMELTYNVTKNWRIFGSVTREDATQSNIASALTTFINERVAYWKATPGLWTGQTTTKDWSGTPMTGEQIFNTDINPGFVAYQSAEGQPSTQLHKWKASAVTNYSFGNGFLKGFNIGTGLRYIDHTVIGNPAIYTMINGVNTVTGLDLAHPYYASGYVGVDAWVGYKTKVYHDKYVLNFQLNGRDLQEGGGFRPIVANSDGTHAVYTIVQPRTWYLTTKLEF